MKDYGLTIHLDRINNITKPVAVVIVNWNGWEDTVGCLESLFPTLSSRDQVIVCDNASTNDSMGHIKTWARHTNYSVNGAPAGTNLAGWIEYDRNQAEHGGAPTDPQLVLVNTGANLGFAGANNVGLRYALERGHQFFWLLNGDTIVNSTSLTGLLQRMEEDSSVGMCGSTLVYFHEPDVIQAMGGARFDFAQGIGAHLGLGQNLASLPDRQAIEAQLDYVVGASMLVSRAFLERVGLICEDYFLYFEEIDWATRAKGMFKLAWAPTSIVLHKEGGSIGSNHRARPSDTSLSFIYRSRLLYARRHTPEHFWRVCRRVGFEALVYAKRRDFSAVSIVVRRLLGQMFKMSPYKS